MTIEARVDDGPAGDGTRRRRERAPLGIDLAGLVVGGFDVAIRVGDLRIGGIAHGIPIDPGTVLHRVADHCVTHVARPPEPLQFVEIGRVVERKEIRGHRGRLLVSSPDFGLGADARSARCIDPRQIGNEPRRARRRAVPRSGRTRGPKALS
jgi:hypothetical protein